MSEQQGGPTRGRVTELIGAVLLVALVVWGTWALIGYAMHRGRERQKLLGPPPAPDYALPPLGGPASDPPSRTR